MRKVGLLGGSFDPVHNAHVALAHAALDALALHEVRWIPAGQPWQKSRAMTAATHREAMVRLAIAEEPRFVLDRSELQRQGPTYTLETVREMHAAWPGAELTLIIGQDQYAGMHTWHGWQALLGMVQLAVAARPGAERAVNAEVLTIQHRNVPLPMLDISSSDIRQQVARGQNIDHLVPPQVARYIEHQALYRAIPRS